MRNLSHFEQPSPTTTGSPVAPGFGGMFGRITLAVFVICQASDGLLTYFAVQIFGHSIEGNPLLVTWMSIAGAGPTILVAKLGAVACGLVLYIHGTHRALAVLTAIYLCVAVVPWLYLFSAH